MKLVLWITTVLLPLFSNNNYVTGQSCNSNQFRCTDGKCIDQNQRCDDSFDCPDNSDEKKCDNVQNCPEGLLKCDNGKCMMKCPIPTQAPTTDVITTETTTEQTKLLKTSQSSTIQPQMSETTIKQPARTVSDPDSDDEDNLLVYVGIAVALVVIVALIIIGILCYKRTHT